MAIPQSGGAGGLDAGYIPLLDFLRSKLGGYFFQREGMPVEDVAYVNLIRLRALFEQTGRDNLLFAADNTQGDKRLTVHEAAFGTNSDRISGAVNALFGQPGRININLGGNAMPDGTDARVSVRNQWTDMQRLGDPDMVLSQPAPTDFTNLAGPGDRDPRPADTGSTSGGPPSMPSPPQSEQQFSGNVNTSGTGGTGGAGGSSGGGGSGEGWAGMDSSLPADGTGRQIPGGEQVWNVDGDIYLAYSNPRQPDLWMVWHVENPDRLNAIYGDSMPAFDRTMSRDEFKRLSPWFGGASAELANKSEDPWTQFNYDFKEAAKLRPWLNDPSMQAVMQGAYLEGRAPTKDELSQTDWWNDHTADERAWLEESVTLGRDELHRRREDAARAVGDALRQAGINDAPRRVVEFIAEQRLTGKWSESYASEQVRKLADPFAPGRLDSSLKDVLDGDELDTTRKFEDEVRQLATTWLGPTMGRMGERELARWAGRFRNDPDAQVEFVEKLRQQRLALFPGYENPNLTYEDIVQPVRNLATNVWGQAVTDEEMLVDLANTRDYTEMATRLRRTGLRKGVTKVVNDSLEGLGQTALGERVVQSAI